MRQQVPLFIIAMATFVLGVAAAHAASGVYMQRVAGITANLTTARVTTPTQFDAPATIVSVDTASRTLLVDIESPYARDEHVRALINYTASTSLRGNAGLLSPFTDTVASLRPGQRLFIFLAREEGPLLAKTISLPRFPL